MKRILLVLLTFLPVLSSFGQNIPIYHWRSHLPYTDGICVVEAGTKIYCATKTGLFYYDKSDNHPQGLSKVDGFSDVFVKTLAYDAAHDNLFIAYQTGNIDVLHKGKITNIPLFLNNNITINSITINGDSAYFATSGGVQVSGISICRISSLDFPQTITDGCLSAKGVNRTAVLRDTLYSCSFDSGVKRIPLSSTFLNDCNKWEKVSKNSCSNIVSFNGRIFGSFGGVLRTYNGSTWTDLAHGDSVLSLEVGNGKVVMGTNTSISIVNPDLSFNTFVSNQQNDVIIDKQGTVWIAKNTYALVNTNQQGVGTNFFGIGGKPSTTLGSTAYGYHNEIWVSCGFYKNDNSAAYDNHGFYMFDGENWQNYNQSTITCPMNPDIRDFMGMAKDTVTNHLWLASLDSGLVDFDPATKCIVKIYYNGNTNNKLPPHTPASDVKFDKDGNLWACFYRPGNNQQLAMRTRSGVWKAITETGTSVQPQVNNIIIDDFGFVWLIDSRNSSGVWIYNNTTNRFAVLTTAQGSGNLPSGNVSCIAKDKTNQVWMGTTAGPCVYSDPSLLFGNQSFDVQRPYVSSGVNSGYLLAAQSVNCIAIDGANRKWFGTNDGAWLTSADGTTIISHFNASNSPLVSNQINSIAINGVTGEVFFVTDKGIVSYRGTGTDGGDQNQDVYAFPNPVRPGYNGPIAIRGLVTDANVKITDITGALVYETTANGGEAIWDGKNFSGRAANSGVYLAFITNSDGSQTKIVKILIVR